MNEEVELNEEEEIDLRSALEDAIDESEEAGRPEEDTEESVGLEAEKRPRDESGRFAPKDSELAEPGDNPEQPVDNLQETVQDEPQHLARPPQSWKPVAQQEWASLPTNVREEVMRREYDVQRFMQDTAPVRKMGEQLIEAAEPFMGLIQSEGATPVQAARSMFETAAVLKAGTPVQKASMLAQIITQYGIPLDLLDTVLSEGMKHGMQPTMSNQLPPQPPQPQVDPREIAAQAAHMARQEMEQQQQYTAAVSDVEQFIKDHPPAGYLRNEMADLIDAYPGMTLQEAYDNAILNHPDLKSLERPAAPPVADRQDRTRRARKAASSLRSNPNPVTEVKPDTLRGALEQAFDEAG